MIWNAFDRYEEALRAIEAASWMPNPVFERWHTIVHIMRFQVLDCVTREPTPALWVIRTE